MDFKSACCLWLQQQLVFCSEWSLGVSSGGSEFAMFCTAETLELVVMFQYFTKSLERFMRDSWSAAPSS